jgi:hypothetical protein
MIAFDGRAGVMCMPMVACSFSPSLAMKLMSEHESICRQGRSVSHAGPCYSAALILDPSLPLCLRIFSKHAPCWLLYTSTHVVCIDWASTASVVFPAPV